MTTAALATAALAWAFGWGWWSHDASPREVALSALWPLIVPVGIAYHAWRWGLGQHWYIYPDTRWWQRGDRERRPR